MSATELVERIRGSFAGHGGFDDLDSRAVADAFVATLEPYVTDDFSCRMVGVGDRLTEVEFHIDRNEALRSAGLD